MRHFLKTILLVFGVLIITFSCQKNDEIIEQQNTYDIPSIEAARLYFNENSNLGQLGINQHFRTTSSSLNTDWENSKAKKYKEEPQDNLDILYTPIYLPTAGHAKSFIGTVEVNGEMQSKIFVLIYTASDNRLAFSGYMLIYDLDGAIEHAYKYQEGQQVASGLPSLTTGNLNRNGENGEDDPDCDFPLESMDCLLEWIGGDWFGLDGLIQDDTIEIIASGDSSTGSFSGVGDLGNPSISIPILGEDNSAGGNPWWNGNTVSAEALAIVLALELEHLALPEAQWLLNEASQEQLQNIADFLNDNRVKDNATPDELADNGIDQNQMTEISQAALELALFMINTMIENPNVTFEEYNEFDENSTAGSYLVVESLEEYQEFIDKLHNPNFTYETIYDSNDPSKVVAKFRAYLDLYSSMTIYVTQHLGTDYQYFTDYSISSVTSTPTGFTFALGWTQEAWDYNNYSYEVTTNIYGTVTVYFVFKGIGRIYSEDLHYQVKMNATDGSNISADLIDD